MTDLIGRDVFEQLAHRYRGPSKPTAERRALQAAARVVDRAGIGTAADLERRYTGGPGIAPIPELGKYARDPVAFGRDIMGITIEFEKLNEMAESVRDNRITDVQGAHAVGKSWYAGRIIIPWWIYSVGGAFVTTAGGFRQVRRALWKGIRRAHSLIAKRFGEDAAGRCDITQLAVTEYQYGYGFTSAKHDPESAHGEHEELLLLVIDEANTLEQARWDSLRSLATGERNRELRLANPTAPDTPFFRSCKRGDEPGQHKTIKISAFDHPNVKAKREIIPGAVTLPWVDDTIREYGEDSSYCTARVFAEFPEETEEALIPRKAFEAAIQRYVDEPQKWAVSGPARLGVDVGERRDRTALATVRNARLLTKMKTYKPIGDDRDIARGVGYVKAELRELPKESVANIDGTGVGAGMASVMLDEKWNVVSVKVGQAARDDAKYVLLRDELAGTLRERVLKGSFAIKPPETADERREMERLKDDLAAMHWDRDVHGRFKLEPKVKTKDRLGRSPDSGDAFILGAAEIGATKRTKVKFPEAGRRKD